MQQIMQHFLRIEEKRLRNHTFGFPPHRKHAFQLFGSAAEKKMRKGRRRGGRID